MVKPRAGAVARFNGDLVAPAGQVDGVTAILVACGARRVRTMCVCEGELYSGRRVGLAPCLVSVGATASANGYVPHDAARGRQGSPADGPAGGQQRPESEGSKGAFDHVYLLNVPGVRKFLVGNSSRLRIAP